MKSSKQTVNKILHYSKVMQEAEKNILERAAQDQGHTYKGGAFYNVNVN